jgi:hypothetical protein
VLLWDVAIEEPCFALPLRFWHAWRERPDQRRLYRKSFHWSQSGLLFPGPNGAPLSRAALHNALRRLNLAEERNGIGLITPEKIKPDAIACANDRTAGHVMHSLIGLNYQIPKDVRIIGFDDIQYANLLPISLTTIHQPCHDMGIVAAAAMLERVATPDIPTREMLLDCRLVVRDSCGARASGERSMLPISDGLTAVFG